MNAGSSHVGWLNAGLSVMRRSGIDTCWRKTEKTVWKMVERMVVIGGVYEPKGIARSAAKRKKASRRMWERDQRAVETIISGRGKGR